MGEEANTEKKILDAAEKVFQDKGYYGARMREIAEEAGINKGLLHYYFKTKNKLFEAIFSLAKNRMVSKIQQVLEMDLPLYEKVDLIVDQYMGLLLKNPALPRFVINELNNNPDQFVGKHFNEGVKATFQNFQKAIQKEVDEGKISAIDARQLLMNIMSLIVFPFIGRPIIQSILAVDNKGYMELMKERKEHIKSFIKQAVRA